MLIYMEMETHHVPFHWHFVVFRALCSNLVGKIYPSAAEQINTMRKKTWIKLCLVLSKLRCRWSVDITGNYQDMRAGWWRGKLLKRYCSWRSWGIAEWKLPWSSAYKPLQLSTATLAYMSPIKWDQTICGRSCLSEICQRRGIADFSVTELAMFKESQLVHWLNLGLLKKTKHQYKLVE